MNVHRFFLPAPAALALVGLLTLGAIPAAGQPWGGWPPLDPCLFDPLPAVGCEKPDFTWKGGPQIGSFPVGGGQYVYVTLELRNRGGAIGVPAQTTYTVDAGQIVAITSPEPMTAWADAGLLGGFPPDPSRWTTRHGWGLAPQETLTVTVWIYVDADAPVRLVANANSDFHWGPAWLPQEITRANNMVAVEP